MYLGLIIFIGLYLIAGFCISILFAALSGCPEKASVKDILYWTFLWLPMLIKNRII